MLSLVSSLDENSDESLLEQWKGGNAVAGNLLFRRHFDLMYRFFSAKVPSQVAPDLIQETLLACVTAAERFRGESTFRSYLFGIARHVLFGYFKKKRRGREGRFDAGVTSLVDLGTSPTKARWRKEESRLLYEGLRRLPLEAQLLLEMHYWDDMTTAELAVVFEVPQGTIKSRLRLARNALKTKVEEVGRSGPLVESATGNLDRWAASIRAELETG